MISFDSIRFKQLILVSAALRGVDKFQEAVVLVESNIPELDKDCLFNVYKGMGNEYKATEYAKKIAKMEPDLPSIELYL